MQTATVQGVPVRGFPDAAALIAAVDGLRRAGRPATVAYVNVHVLNVAAADPDLAGFLRQVDICYPDGKGVVWGARLLGKDLPGRLTGADWIFDLAAAAAAGGWRIGWLGGERGVAEEAAAVLQNAHPGLEIVYTGDGFFAKQGPENDAVIAAINAARLDVLLVGMGTPVQERWVAENRRRLDVPVVWCLGATADFVSGRVSRGPRWLYERQEWLARLAADPRRLWRRFLVGNPRFMARVLAERLQRR